MKRNYVTCFALVLLINFVSLLQANIVAEYDFEDTNESVAYNVARSGIVKGNATKTYDAGRDSNVLNCIGTYGSYVSLGDYNPSERTNQLTITAWIKWNGPTSYPCGILSKRVDFHNDMMWSFGISSSSNKLMLQSTYDTITSADTVSVSQWVHVAVTLDSDGNVVFYINGDIAGTTTDFRVGDGTLAELCLGSFQGYWYGLNGSIDDLQIYNTVLTETDIEAVLNSGSPAGEGLVSRYEFENSSTTTVYDSSYLGQINNAVKEYDITRDSNVLLCNSTYNKYVFLGHGNPTQGTDELTISAWIRWNGGSGDRCCILSKRSSYTASDMMWSFGIRPSNSKLFLEVYGRFAYSDVVIPTDEWVHVAVTVLSSKIVVFYVNGEEAGHTFEFSMNSGTSANLYLGSSQGPWECFNGYIDDLRIYDKALNFPAIERVYDSTPISQVAYKYPAHKAIEIDGASGVKLAWVDDDSLSAYDVYFGQDFEQIETASRVPGDVNGDGIVGEYDFIALADAWLGEGSIGEVVDFNSDGVVNAFDFVNFAIGIDSEDSSRHVYKGSISDGSLALSALEAGEYFWRVDRIKNGQVVKGDVRSFICNGSLSKEVILDPHVQQPVRLFDPHLDPDTGKVVTVEVINFNNSNLVSRWGLAQWGCNYSLEGAELQSLDNGAFKKECPLTSIVVSPFRGVYSDFTMQMDTRLRYGTTPRTSDEGWPGLIMNQDYVNKYHPRLNDLVALRYHIEVKLLHAERFEYEGYTPDRHAASFLNYFTVQNLKEFGTPGYGDYLWFGIPIYDDRWTELTAPSEIPYVQGDSGTGKMMYQRSRGFYTSEDINDGDWITMEGDLLPFMYDALEEAWDRGFLPDSDDPNDYYIGGMNIGWEIPGINNASIQFRNFSLKAIYP